MTETRPRIPAVWLVLCSIVSVQVGAAFAKDLFGVVPPITMTWLRVVSAALVLLMAVRPWRALPRSGTPEVAKRWRLLAGFMFCMLGMNLLIYQALEHIPMGIAITLEFLGPLTVAVLGSRRLLDLVWVVLAGAGVALLGFSPAPLNATGVLFAIGAGACWGGYILVGARMAGRWRGVDALALACTAGAIALAPFAIAAGGRDLLHPRVLLVGALVGLLSTIVPYTLELHALRFIPTGLFGILMSIEPAVAALAALLLLGERLGPADLLAMGCVIAASMGSARTTR